MDLGQRDLYDAAKSYTNRDMVKLVEGPNIHRILRGPVRIRTAFWPTKVLDEATGETKKITKAAVVEIDSDNIFEKIGAAEIKVQAMLGIKQPSSSIKPKDKWNYLIIDRSAPVDPETGLPKIQVVAYPYSVYKKLGAIEEERSTKNEGKLRNGLIWMYDIIVKKIIDHNKEAKYGTSYDAFPAEGNPVEGFVPVEWLNRNFADISKEITEADAWDKFFSKEDQQAWNESQLVLEDMFKPSSNDELIAKLQESPIDIASTNVRDRTLFVRELEKMEVAFLAESEQTKELPAASVSTETTEEVQTSKQLESKEEPKADLFNSGTKVNLSGKQENLDWINKK